jgi:3-phenylpropionate/trans-cinnamate dioxygenase ferredoxin reductase subunit
VLLADGTELPADAVVVGVGVRPNTDLADQAGLPVDNGILVDESLRTGDPDIYAAGDVANAYHPLLARHIRVEHWANALNSGPAAARAMLGQPVSYDQLPYFYTDQYDLGMEYTGDVPRGTSSHVILRGEPASGAYFAFWLSDDNHVLAGMQVNNWDTIDDSKSLIRSQKPVDPTRLADTSVALADI